MPATLKLIGLGISLAAVVTAVACGTFGTSSITPKTSKDSAIISRYNSDAQDWTRDGVTLSSASSDNSPIPAGSNTLIIQLQPDTPIQEIIIDGGFVAGGTEPVFDIDGDPDNSGGGAIRIGTLTMDTVDAHRLIIQDTEVVSSNITNVIAHDDELVLNFQTVLVIFVERGASSTLSHTDFRVDRIRILGTGGGVDTHLERLTVTNSGFLGTIRIEDVKIDSLVLTGVSLED